MTIGTQLKAGARLKNSSSKSDRLELLAVRAGLRAGRLGIRSRK